MVEGTETRLKGVGAIRGLHDNGLWHRYRRTEIGRLGGGYAA